MFCRNCGSEVEKDSNFCPCCGFALKESNSDDRGSENASSLNRDNDTRDFDSQGSNAATFRSGSSRVTPVIPSEPAKAKVSSKSKIIAGLLAIFLGAYGVHNFYLKYTGKAVTQLILTLLGCCTLGISSMISILWSFIEGIMILCGGIKKDGYGLTLID